MIMHDPLAGRAMARGVRKVGLGLAAAWWIASLVTALTGPRFDSPTLQDGALIALAIPLVWALTSLRSRDGPVVQLQVFVVLGVVIRLVEPALAAQPAGNVDYSPLMPVLTASAAIVGFVVTPRWGIPIIAVHAGVIFTQRLPVVGFAQGTAEAVDFLVSDLIIMIVIWALREGLDGVALATARALDAETRATSARHRTAIRQRFDGLVHDKVLAALTLVSRGLNAEAAGLARDALTELAPGSDARVEAASDSLALITEHASLLGLELTLVADTWPSGPEGDALRAATCEALTNVLRHSGVRRASIRTSRHARVFVVEISDDGAGFDVAAIPPDRIGVKERIVGALAAVGASAEFTSGKGLGTRITMTAPLTSEDATRGRPALPKAMWWAVPLAVASVGAHASIGALHLSQVYSRPVVYVVGFALIPILGVLVTAIRSRGLGWYITLAASILTWAVLLANVRDPFVSDWRTWFIGPLSGLAAIVAWRRGVWQGLAVIVLGTGLGVVGFELRGEASFAPVLMATVQGVVYTPAVAWIRSVIDRASCGTAEQLRIAAKAEVETSLAESLDEQISARRKALDLDAIPLLRAIATGEALSVEQRDTCREVEASTRDQLIASTLLSRDLVSAIGAARSRGCRVLISGVATPGPGLDGLRVAALALLTLSRAGDRVTLRASTDGSSAQGTAVLVGPHAATLTLPELPAVCTVADMASDPDSILVDVSVEPAIPPEMGG